MKQQTNNTKRVTSWRSGVPHIMGWRGMNYLYFIFEFYFRSRVLWMVTLAFNSLNTPCPRQILVQIEITLICTTHNPLIIMENRLTSCVRQMQQTNQTTSNPGILFFQNYFLLGSTVDLTVIPNCSRKCHVNGWHTTAHKETGICPHFTLGHLPVICRALAPRQLNNNAT